MILPPTIARFKDGETVFRQGDLGDRMYVVMSGAVSIYREAHGIETKLGQIGFGEMFGELSLFDQRPRSASARAMGPTELRVITQDEFMQLDCDLLIRKMLIALAQRLRSMDEALEKAKMTEGPEWEQLVQALRDRDWLE